MIAYVILSSDRSYLKNPELLEPHPEFRALNWEETMEFCQKSGIEEMKIFVPRTKERADPFLGNWFRHERYEKTFKISGARPGKKRTDRKIETVTVRRRDLVIELCPRTPVGYNIKVLSLPKSAPVLR